MSVCFVVVPVVAGSWPIISAAIITAGAAMGYKTIRQLEQDTVIEERPFEHTVQLVMPDSEVVADAMQRGEMFTLQRDDIEATFFIDGRGACNVHMSGVNRSNAELEAIGQELMDRVRQQYAYAKVMQELEQRGFQVTQQQVEENQSIRITVRRS